MTLLSPLDYGVIYASLEFPSKVHNNKFAAKIFPKASHTLIVSMHSALSRPAANLITPTNRLHLPQEN